MRLFFPERTLICKEPLGPDAQRRLRHEVEMLERLRGADGVAHLVHAPPDPRSIVLEDAGASSLRESATPLASDELIELALCLAQAVSGMHRRRRKPNGAMCCRTKRSQFVEIEESVRRDRIAICSEEVDKRWLTTEH
jgi:hypothetical protein